MQPQIVLAKEFEVAAVGGMGAGKTYAACVAAIRHAVKYPGARVLVARFTYDELIKTTKHMFFEIVNNKGLRKYFVRPKNWDVREGTNYARLTNGSEFFFSNLDKSLDKHKNVEYSFVFIDQLEEIEFDVYQLLLLRTRLNAVPPSDRHVMGVANDEGDNWIRRRFLTMEAPHGRPTALASRKLIRGSSLDNPHLDEGVRAQYLQLPPELQRRWVFAPMDATSSRLIPDFRVVDDLPIPGHWPRYLGIDPARSTGVTCALWVAVNPDDEPYHGLLPNAPHVFAEYWAEGRDAEVHAKAINAISGNYPPRVQVMDKSSWVSSLKSKHFGSISVADLYINAGLPVVPSTGDEWTRVMLYVNAQRRGLTVARSCKNLLRQGPEYRLKGQLNTEGKPLRITAKSTFHSVDAGGYALALIPARAVSVDLRELLPAFDIAEGVDRGSKLHWEEFRRHLPMRKGNESVVTLGMDETQMAEDDSERTFNLSEAEDEVW